MTIRVIHHRVPKQEMKWPSPESRHPVIYSQHGVSTWEEGCTVIGTRKEAIIQNVHSSCNQQDHVHGRPRNKGTAESRDMERKTERENPKYSTKKTRDKIEKQASREREKEGPAAIAVDDVTHPCKLLTALGTKQEILRTTCALSLGNLIRGASL